MIHSVRWTEKGELAITACPCECCERAFDLVQEGLDPDSACACLGYVGNLNQGQCHCWFCVEVKG